MYMNMREVECYLLSVGNILVIVKWKLQGLKNRVFRNFNGSNFQKWHTWIK